MNFSKPRDIRRIDLLTSFDNLVSMSLAALNEFALQVDRFLWPDQDARLHRKRERILQSATELFVKLGYRKTSMDEVARLAGVAKGTVYLYYRTKAELVAHAIALEKRNHLARMAPLEDASLSPRDRLRSLIALGVIMSREMPLTTSLIQGDHQIELALQELDEEVLKDINDQQMAVMMQLLDAATDHALTRATLETRGRVLVDLMFAVTTSQRTNVHGMSWETYANALADVIVNGVVNDTSPEIPATFLANNIPVDESSSATTNRRTA